MRDLDWYMDKARENSGLISDRKLAVALDIAATGPNYWRARKTWPSETHMVALAELAGVDPGIALLDLARWRSKDQKTADVWKRLASMVATLAIPLLVALTLVGSPKPAQAAELMSGDHVYYGKRRRFRLAGCAA